MNFQTKRPEERVLRLLHKPVKVSEMNNPGEIGFEEFNAVLGNKMKRHAESAISRQNRLIDMGPIGT